MTMTTTMMVALTVAMTVAMPPRTIGTRFVERHHASLAHHMRHRIHSSLSRSPRERARR